MQPPPQTLEDFRPPPSPFENRWRVVQKGPLFTYPWFKYPRLAAADVDGRRLETLTLLLAGAPPCCRYIFIMASSPPATGLPPRDRDGWRRPMFTFSYKFRTGKLASR